MTYKTLQSNLIRHLVEVSTDLQDATLEERTEHHTRFIEDILDPLAVVELAVEHKLICTVEDIEDYTSVERSGTNILPVRY